MFGWIGSGFMNRTEWQWLIDYTGLSFRSYFPWAVGRITESSFGALSFRVDEDELVDCISFSSIQVRKSMAGLHQSSSSAPVKSGLPPQELLDDLCRSVLLVLLNSLQFCHLFLLSNFSKLCSEHDILRFRLRRRFGLHDRSFDCDLSFYIVWIYVLPHDWECLFDCNWILLVCCSFTC